MVATHMMIMQHKRVADFYRVFMYSVIYFAYIAR